MMGRQAVEWLNGNYPAGGWSRELELDVEADGVESALALEV